MRRLISSLPLLALLINTLSLQAAISTARTPYQEALALLDTMSPEERVGQLFLVSFQGATVEADSQIATLIRRYHIGGVVIQARNDNLLPAPGTAAGLRVLIAALQQTEYDAAYPPDVLGTPAATPSGAYVPLLVAIAHEGDGPPYTEILDGVTAVPSAMALGATWDPAQAEAVGQVVGAQLSALGINMLLGPSLDVLEMPNPTGDGDLGTRTFGGDAFWVGQLGARYVAGVHAGAGGRMLVVAKHFPGQGGSDRTIDEEVPTVRKSLEQLKLVELVPFVAVTGGADDAQSSVDGLLVTHIRYQGLQGNIRDTTAPVSLDPQALQEQLLAQPEFAAWRAGGGLVVSESLGVRAIRRFKDPTELVFPARLVARDALLAGNDLLQATEFAAPGSTEFATLVDTLTFFAQKYGEDPVFARRVDEAVARLLAAKIRLYPAFNVETVLAPGAALLPTAGSRQLAVIAQQAATLISPSAAELSERLPAPPARTDRIVFFTDTRQAAQCSACAPVPTMAVDDFQRAVLRFYGPQASGQVSAGRLQSFSLADLSDYLSASSSSNVDAQATAAANPVGEALSGAQWLVFSILDVRPDVAGSNALQALLATRPDLTRQKRVVVFAFNAPYYLDATEIGKLSAYYGLYSRGSAFVEVAARLLFQEIRPAGASPVSIPGVGYDLVQAMMPNPAQVIPLCVGEGAEPCESTAEAPEVKVGDTVTLRTGTILDHNGHPVPDGTPVTFALTFVDQGIPDMLLHADSQAGIAHAAYRLDRPGRIDIRVASVEALNSWSVQVDAQSDPTVPISITPTAMPSPVPSPTPVRVVKPPVEPTASEGQRASAGDLTVVLLGALAFGALTYWLGQQEDLKPHWRVRLALSVVAGALAGYNYLAWGLPGAVWLYQLDGQRPAVLVALIGSAAGLAAGLAGIRWELRASARAEGRDQRQ